MDRGATDQIANICWIIKKAREFQKNIYFCFIDYAKAFDCVDHHKLWKILKEMGISENLTCLLKNLYAGQEATVRTGHGTTDWFQIGKGVRQRCILSPCLLNLYAEYIMQNAGLDEAQAGLRKGRGTREQMANVRWVMGKAREFQKSVYCCFVDYAQAFACVDHGKLWTILREMGIPDPLTCLSRLELDTEPQTRSK